MSRVVFLGTASAVAYEGHQNSHLVVESGRECVLVDSVGHDILRLGQAGLHINDLTGMVVTHFHPDHVTGLPLLLMNMWLLDRDAALDIYGPEHALTRVEEMMALFEWEEWPEMYPVHFHPQPLEDMALAVDTRDLRIYTSPMEHLVPTLGLRVEFLAEDFVVAYSSDTDPCPQMIQLARGGDVLIHEAAGDYPGHTSAAEAGEIARKSGVNSVYLIHYSFHNQDAETLIREAQNAFSGDVFLAQDLMEINISG